VEVAETAAWAGFTARNAAYADDDDAHGRPDRSGSVASEASAAQWAAIHALVETGMSYDEARARTIEIVRAELPWSAVEPHVRALGNGAACG
jgi:hypothetical protein